MSFDKAKVIRAAEKYLTQGKILPAITEYRKITAQEPNDFTALNMLGDLFVRVDNKQEAIACFTRIADHYREQGFNLKAIAMLKKINRLEPLDPSIAYQLATLYEAQGLAVDARNQYLVVAEFYTKQNDVRKTLELLHRVADLDSHNVETRLKLAEGYLRESMPEEAAEAFSEAGSQLLSRGNYERAIEAFNRALEFSTSNYTAWSGIVSAYTALNAPDEAAQALCEAGALDSNDIELITLLAQAYIADENVVEAEKVTSVLLRVDPSGYTPMLDVARLYLTANQLDDCVRVLYTIVDPILNSRAEAALIYVLDEALARNPEHLAALHLLVRAYRWQHEEENLHKTLVRVVEVAQTLGLQDEEYQALEQLCNLSLNNEQYRQRLSELKGERSPDENQQVLMPESEAALYDSLAGLTSGVAHTEVPPTTTEFNLLVDVEPEMVPLPEPSFAASGEAGESFAELNTEVLATGGDGALDEHNTRALQQELESVEFYINQGYYDIAQDTLDMLERQFGEQPNIIACQQRLQATQGNLATAAYEEETAFPDNQGPEQEVNLDFTDEAAVLAEDSLLFAATASNAPDSVAVEPDFYLNENDADLTGFVAENSEELLLIVDETPLPAVFQADPEPQEIPVALAPPAEAEPAKPALDPGLTAIFDEFRDAVEEESQMPSDDDFETHYNLGLAYKEMDLTDEAVEEFQIAAKLVSPQDETQRYLDCCSLLGHCFMLKNLPRVAVMWFQKGLETTSLPEEAVLALHYEIGLAYEHMGELNRAIETFMQVYGVNVSYRGVNEKLRELQSLQPV